MLVTIINYFVVVVVVVKDRRWIRNTWSKVTSFHTEYNYNWTLYLLHKRSKTGKLSALGLLQKDSNLRKPKKSVLYWPHESTV